MKNCIKRLVCWIVALGFIVAAAEWSNASDQGKEDPIVIGAPIPLKSRYGLNGHRGMVLAIEEINAAGGVLVGQVKRPLKLEVADTDDQEPGTSVSEVLRIVEDLVVRRKVDLLSGGPVLSECGLAALDLIARLKKIHLVSIGCYAPDWDRKVSQDRVKYRYSFRVSGSAKWYAKEAVDLLTKMRQKHGFDKLFLSSENIEMCQKGTKIVEELATKQGWKIVGRDIYPSGTADFTQHLEKCRDSGAQVMFVWDRAPETRTLIRQWHSMRIPALPLGFMQSAEDSGFWKSTKGGCAYSVVTLSETGNVTSRATPKSNSFFIEFEKRWQQPARSTGCVSAYESIYVIKDAIERAGTLENEALIKEIEKTNMKGVRGTVRFDENHQVVYGYDPNESVLGCWVQWLDGKRVQVFPDAGAMAEIELPPWMKQ